MKCIIFRHYLIHSLLDKDGGCCWRMWRCGRAAVRRTVTQQQLLLSGTTRPADVLAVRVVEPQESQDGLGQPQSRHTPQRRLCQAELCVEGRSVHIQVQRNRLGLCTAVRPFVVISHSVTPGGESQRQDNTGPSGQEENAHTQQHRQEGREQGVIMSSVQIEEAPPALRCTVQHREDTHKCGALAGSRWAPLLHHQVGDVSGLPRQLLPVLCPPVAGGEECAAAFERGAVESHGDDHQQTRHDGQGVSRAVSQQQPPVQLHVTVQTKTRR